MPIIPLPPEDVKESFLFKVLIRKSQSFDGLSERVNTLISTISPLLDLILASPFREYTLHNKNHSKKLVHLSEYIIPKNIVEGLSALEIAVIIISCYLHDLGMCLTSSEREQIISSQEFEDELRSWPQLWYELEKSRKNYKHISPQEQNSLETRIFQLQEAGIASFLRSRHANPERYKNLIQKLKENSGRFDLFQVNDVSFENEVVEICSSHNLDVGVLLDALDPYTDRFPRDMLIGGFKLNMQYCAAVLRLVDILDFDRERTPRILFESLGMANSEVFPGREISLKEWNKHMAVHSVELRDEEIIVSADSKHPTIERAVKDYCAVVEREIRDTMSVVRKNRPEIANSYQIDLPLTVRAQIRSIGYVYKDMFFKLDESSISALLMGEGLYANKSVALRELIQNAIDACVFRRFLNKEPEYQPLINVKFEVDEKDRTWLEVSDNGIGMDEHVLSNYFFRIGNSYYQCKRLINRIYGETTRIVSRSKFCGRSFLYASSLSARGNFSNT